MGCFDTVIVRCPECGRKVGFQSKAGEAAQLEFYLHDAPQEILADLNGEHQVCECGKGLTIRTRTTASLEIT